MTGVVLRLRRAGPDLRLTALAAQGDLPPMAVLIGPPGAAGSSQIALAAVAAVTVIAGQPLALNRASGQLIAGDPAYKPAAFVLGLAEAATAAGFIATAKLGNFTLADWTALTGGAALSPGVPYFLSEDGRLSAVPPARPLCLTLIGVAVSATTLHVDPDPPIQL